MALELTFGTLTTKILLAHLSLAACCLSLLSCGGGSIGPDSQSPDPVVVDFPIAYVKRSLPIEDPDDDDDLLEYDIREPYEFRPGAILYLRDSASPSGFETAITANVFVDTQTGEEQLYDVKDLASSYDGQKLLFSMRAPEIEDADEDEQPTWNIWEYNLEDSSLRKIITSDITAEAGHDIMPQYLVDGRIVFASSRQRGSKARLLDEGRPQFNALDEGRDEEAAALHVMNKDGTGIEQITYNPSHDLSPQIMSDGRILFSRMDGAGNHNSFNLYTVYADGTQVSLAYGWHSHTDINGNTVQFGPFTLLEDNTALTLTQNGQTTLLSRTWSAINFSQYVEQDRTIDNQTISAGTPETNPITLSVATDATPSHNGRVHTLTSFNDGTGRYLMSWSPCRVFDPDEIIDANNPNTVRRILPCTDELLTRADIEEAPPLYGLWSLDASGQSQLPIEIPAEGQMIADITALGPRMIPAFAMGKVASGNIDITLVDEEVGVLHIRSVYDFDGIDTATPNITTLSDPAQTTADQRPARFLKLIKSVPMPDDNLVDLPGSAFGRSNQQLMREIIGYTPIAPDGSVKIKVPANVPFAISVVNSQGQRISERHQNWLQVFPGETLECVGCHTANSEVPHGRIEAQPTSANPGASTTGLPFTNTDPTLFANMGETMAEVYTRINGIPEPSMDLLFTDVWTDPALRTPDADLNLRYGDLSTTAPVSANSCLNDWTVLCRAVIHYEDHIHPLWSVDRSVVDNVGTVIADNTCTTCHGLVDAANLNQVPAAQLDLSDGPSSDEPDHFKSYRELLFGDNEQELVNDALVDRLVPVLDGNGNPVFETDENGDLILDAQDNPIPVTQTVAITSTMNVAGALNSGRFFQIFEQAGPTVDHRNFLSNAELRLIAEWLDLGAQYYNDPFVVPQN